MPPYFMERKIDELNEEMLTSLLNERNCFDVELKAEDNDILELHFTLNQEGRDAWLVYSFELRDNKWQPVENTDLLSETGGNFDEIQAGEVKYPFK